jgi:hypothetical protein
VAGVVFTPYAQLAQRPLTVLFTTYCGISGSRIQILGTQPGKSTGFRIVWGLFFGGEKIPRQIKAIAASDA